MRPPCEDGRGHQDKSAAKVVSVLIETGWKNAAFMSQHQIFFFFCKRSRSDVTILCYRGDKSVSMWSRIRDGFKQSLFWV